MMAFPSLAVSALQLSLIQSFAPLKRPLLWLEIASRTFCAAEVCRAGFPPLPSVVRDGWCWLAIGLQQSFPFLLEYLSFS